MNPARFRKFIILIVIVLLSGYLFSCGCDKLAEKAIQKGVEKTMDEVAKEVEKEANKKSSTTTTTETTEKTVPSGKMTDEIFVELCAYDIYLSNQMKLKKITPQQFTTLREAKYKKYGVANDDYVKYVSSTAIKNPEYYAELMKKVDARAKELMK